LNTVRWRTSAARWRKIIRSFFTGLGRSTPPAKDPPATDEPKFRRRPGRSSNEHGRWPYMSGREPCALPGPSRRADLDSPRLMSCLDLSRDGDARRDYRAAERSMVTSAGIGVYLGACPVFRCTCPMSSTSR
jgi:hypothetical protein